MRIIVLALSLFVLSAYAFAAETGDVLKFKGKFGFTDPKEKIEEYRFLDNEKKLLLLGEKTLQIWDVENAKLINSVEHQIPQFAPRGFVSTYLLLGLPKILDWRPFVIEPSGKWIITSEKLGANKFRSAVVRDLQTLKQLAVLNLPDASSEFVTFDDNRREILTFGVTNGHAAFASWSDDDFKLKEMVRVENYDWHQTIWDDKKMIVGAEGKNNFWVYKDRRSKTLTLRDVKTGKIEKEFTAQNLNPKSSFYDTTISNDEKYLMARHDERLFVWELGGDGKPKFEIGPKSPKEDFDIKFLGIGRFIAVKSDGKIRLYDIRAQDTPIIEVAPQNVKENLHFRGVIDDRLMAVGGDGFLRFYEIGGDGKPKFQILSANPKDTIQIFAISNTKKILALADDQKVVALDFKNDLKPLYEIARNSEKERFPAIKIFEDKNLLMISRVNNSEKKAPRTEFYDLPSGKLDFNADFEAADNIKFTPDNNQLYQENLGSFVVWNLAKKKLTNIPLSTYTEQTYDSVTNQTTTGNTYNDEYAEFSPDYRYILRHGDNVTAVFDAETGQQVQILFDTEFVKYNKSNQITKSGLGKSGWTENGKMVYSMVGRRAFSFWEVVK